VTTAKFLMQSTCFCRLLYGFVAYWQNMNNAVLKVTPNYCSESFKSRFHTIDFRVSPMIARNIGRKGKNGKSYLMICLKKDARPTRICLKCRIHWCRLCPCLYNGFSKRLNQIGGNWHPGSIIVVLKGWHWCISHYLIRLCISPFGAALSVLY
jgi:hypothetical protein